MNILLSCIGKRGYLADYFRPHLGPKDRIIGTSNTWWTPGFASCDKGCVLPDINATEYIPSLVDLCRREQVDGLLSLFDPDIEVLSENLGVLRAAGVFPIVCSPEVSHICFDKYRTYLFLKEQQWDILATFTELRQAREAIDEQFLDFPVFVKPRFGYGSRDLFLARNVQELEAFFGYASDMIVQARAIGTEHHLDVCVDSSGQVISVVPKRKIRMRNGETDQAVTVAQAELMELGVHLGQTLGRLGHIGPLDVDVFADHHNITVLEMNPRFGGAYPASHLAGADFPRVIVSMLRGQRVEPCLGQFKSGIAMIKDHRILGGSQLNIDEWITGCCQEWESSSDE